MKAVSISSKPMRRNCRFESKTFDAYTIAFGIRNVPRIDAALREAHRVLKPGGRFLCLEFSKVDVPVLDRIYDAYSFNVIPKLGQHGDGGCGILPVSGGIDPPLPDAGRLRADDRGGGLQARDPPHADGRRRRHPFRLEDLTRDRQPRSSRPQSARRLRSGPRGRARARRSERPAAVRAAGSADRAAHRAAAGRRRRGAPLDGIDAARSVLREVRPVPGHPSRHRRRGGRPRPGAPAGSHAALPACGSGAHGRGRPRPSHRRAFPRIQRADRRRLHRAGPQGPHPHGGGRGDPSP